VEWRPVWQLPTAALAPPSSTPNAWSGWFPASRSDLAPAGFADQAHGLLARLGTSPTYLTTVLDEAAALVAQTSAACQRPR